MLEASHSGGSPGINRNNGGSINIVIANPTIAK